jgi:hypothetical protein
VGSEQSRRVGATVRETDHQGRRLSGLEGCEIVGQWPGREGKHPACAAPTNSSGLVPVPSSNREAKEYWPSKAPLPSVTFPLPSLSVPSQTALAVRLAMFVVSLVD